MIRSSADNLKPPTVVRKRNRNGTYTWIGLFVGHDRYYLSPAEALSLADRLVDAAEELSIPLSTLREPIPLNGTTTGTSLGTGLEPT